MQEFENRLRFEKVTESLKVGTFLRHSVITVAEILSVLQSSPTEGMCGLRNVKMFIFYSSTGSGQHTAAVTDVNAHQLKRVVARQCFAVDEAVLSLDAFGHLFRQR